MAARVVTAADGTAALGCGGRDGVPSPSELPVASDEIEGCGGFVNAPASVLKNEPSILPKGLNRVLRDDPISRHDGKTLFLRLGNQQSVKWIAMDVWKRFYALQMRWKD